MDLQERAQGNFTKKGSSYACYGAAVSVVELDCLTGEVSFLINRMGIVLCLSNKVKLSH